MELSRLTLDPPTPGANPAESISAALSKKPSTLQTSPLAKLFSEARETGAEYEELERSFFDSLRLKNGVYKTTYPRRLDDLNVQVKRYLPPGRRFQVLDVGISSGVSTLEWVESLENAKAEFHMTGVDLTIDGLLVSFGERLHAVLDRNKWPLLFEVDRQWISNPPRKRHLLRHAFSLAVIRAALQVWARRYREPEESETLKVFGMPARTRSINLVTPRLTNHPAVTILEGNILTDEWSSGPFDVVRAANILNRSYFTDDVLIRIAQNLRRQMAPKGILAVCHTDSAAVEVNRASILQLGEDHRFTVVSRMHGGSEIEELILDLPAAIVGQS